MRGRTGDPEYERSLRAERLRMGAKEAINIRGNGTLFLQLGARKVASRTLQLIVIRCAHLFFHALYSVLAQGGRNSAAAARERPAAGRLGR